jgi:hypothetical protein
MPSVANNRMAHGARNTVSGVISNGATWYESISIDLNGIADPDLLVWVMTFQCKNGAGTDFSASTADSTLTVTDNGDDTATMLVNIPAASLSALAGDYICNIKSTNSAGDGRVIHWAYGIVTFIEAPPSS